MGGAHRAAIAAVAAAGLAGAEAQAQFSAPTPTNIRERLNGELRSAPGAPAPEAGDQLGVFFNNQIIGLHTFTSAQAGSREFSILVSGDNPDTAAVEGPARGAAISFRFFDSSTNSVRTDVRALNAGGETLNLTFQGEMVIEIPGLPLDLTPTREVNALLGATSGGGGDGEGADYDVDGDGEVTKRDAALVLRIVLGGGRAATQDEVSRADVNGDGRVTSQDAIEVLRNR